MDQTENTVPAGASRLAKEVRTAQDALGLDLSGEVVEVLVDEGGTVHADLARSRWGQCHTLRRFEEESGSFLSAFLAGIVAAGVPSSPASPKQAPTRPETTTLGELLTSGATTCTVCLSLGSALASDHLAVWALGAVATLETVEGVRVRSAKAHRDRRNACKGELDALEALPGEKDAAEGLATRLRVQVEAAEEALASDPVKEKLHAKVKTMLVGRGAVNGGYVFDDEPVLLGLTRYVRYEWNETMQDVVELHALRWEGQDGAGPVVLLVPRYVAEYVSTVPKARRNGLHPSATVKGDTELTLETAAKLWDPEGEGALASLVGALQAARMV